MCTFNILVFNQFIMLVKHISTYLHIFLQYMYYIHRSSPGINSVCVWEGGESLSNQMEKICKQLETHNTGKRSIALKTDKNILITLNLGTYILTRQNGVMQLMSPPVKLWRFQRRCPEGDQQRGSHRKQWEYYCIRCAQWFGTCNGIVEISI